MSLASLFAVVLLQAAPSQPGWIQFVPLLMIAVIFYFLLIAPARKRQKDLERTIAELKKGDRVITSGGIYGEVAAVETSALVLKVADGVRLKVAKSAIASREPDGEDKRERR